MFQGDIVKLDSRLLEQNKGDFVGIPKKIVQSRDDYMKHKSGPRFYEPGVEVKGESEDVVAKRMIDWLDEVKDRAFSQSSTQTSNKLLAFSHGNALKYLLKSLMKDKDSHNIANNLKIKNTGLSILEINDDGIVNIKVLNQ